MAKQTDELVKRFTEGEGARRLEESLRDQAVAEHDSGRAGELATCARVVGYEKGEEVISVNGTDTDLCLILVGSVAVDVRGHEIATRRAGQHVGEMATIDPKAVRSATVRAQEPTVVARIAENDFARIAGKHPAMWRCLAIELADRLRQREKNLRQKNEKPTVFIGSTAERLEMARAVQGACQYDPWTVRLWAEGVFGAGKTPIESLAQQLDTLDFGIVVVTADDVVRSRHEQDLAPRDNVVFELGLLMGCLGRERTFMAIPMEEAKTIKLPSDLVGVKPLNIKPGKPEDLAARVGPAVNEFRGIVKTLGCR